MGGPPNDTFATAVTVLVVVRNVTTLNRLFDALPALCSGSQRLISFKFVIQKGSDFSSNLESYLHQAGMTVITWREARKTTWDLILAAHVNRGLARLRGKLVVFAHGAGYSRIVRSSTGSTRDPVGLAPKQISKWRRVFPVAIGLSHENQHEQLPANCPGVRDRTFEVGDPTFDRIVANVARRDIYRTQFRAGNRRVALVTSTWGRHSSAAKAEVLAHRLAAQLPADEWLVLLVLHPNVWFGASNPWELVNSRYRDALDSGVLLVRPHNGWQAAVIAADVVVGDHGSVAFYAAALGTPFLLSTTGLDELAPSSPRVLLSRTADHLDVDGDLRAQLESTIAEYDPEPIKRITEQTLGRPGEALQLLRAKCYELLGIDPPTTPCRIEPLLDPSFERRAAPTAHLMRAEVTMEAPASGTVRLSRFPAIVSDHRARESPIDLPEIVIDTEVDPSHRDNAEILVHPGTTSMDSAERWFTDRTQKHPGCALFAVSTGTRCILRWRDGPTFHAMPELLPDQELAVPVAYLAAAALYGWASCLDARPRSGVTLKVMLASMDLMIRAGPVGSHHLPPRQL